MLSLLHIIFCLSHLTERFDYIFFTRNNVVATIVMAAAAEKTTSLLLLWNLEDNDKSGLHDQPFFINLQYSFDLN